MVSIEGTKITLTRGDTLSVKLTLNDSEGNPYQPTEGDVIRFAMKKHYNDEECILVKNIPTDTMILRIDSDDTKALPQPSEYVYDVQLTFADGTVCTFINKAKLKITEEVE